MRSRASTMSKSASSLPFKISPSTVEGDPNHVLPTFPIPGFKKHPSNPILKPEPSHEFESAYLYNPCAMVLDETVFIFYRAQDAKLKSCVGLAWSEDGVNFTRLDRPIISPTEPWELPGGCEDPRIVRVDGTFYITYTGWDLKTPKLCLAYSQDLLNWTKLPPLFPGWLDVYSNPSERPAPRLNHSKSGAIIPERCSKGLYHMYFGESLIYHATSPNMLDWTPDPPQKFFAKPIFPWEQRLIEPGPAPIKTRCGRWLHFYNGVADGTAGYTRGQYSTGQMLIDPEGPVGADGVRGPVARVETPLLVPDQPNETEGQVNHVVFTEGIVQFKGKWYLYFGQADSELGVAVADVQP